MKPKEEKRLILPILITIGSVVGPALCVVLQVNLNRKYGWFFVFFMAFHALVRAWETFFTTKEKNRLEVSEDWTLILVTVVYIFFSFLVVLEFFLVNRRLSFTITSIGALLYLISYRLRWWGMKALGSQWAIHAVGEKKVKRTRLLHLGPYKYVRHPIYVSILLDQLSLLLISNALYTTLYFIVFSTSAYYIRMHMEEIANVKKFGDAYIQYQREVSMFFPFKKIGRAFSQR